MMQGRTLFHHFCWSPLQRRAQKQAPATDACVSARNQPCNQTRKVHLFLVLPHKVELSVCRGEGRKNRPNSRSGRRKGENLFFLHFYYQEAKFDDDDRRQFLCPRAYGKKLSARARSLLYFSNVWPGFEMKEIKLCVRESKHSEMETLRLFHRVTWNFFYRKRFFPSHISPRRIIGTSFSPPAGEKRDWHQMESALQL